MIMERKERLKVAYNHLRNNGAVHTQQDVADKMSKPKSNISSAFKGNEKYLTDNFLRDFCKVFKGINEVWLLTGEGAMLVGDIIQSGGGNTANTGNGTVNNTTNNCRGCGGADKKAAKDITDLGDRVTALEEKPFISYTRGKPYYDVDFLGGFDIILNDQTVNPEYLIDFKKYDDADYWCNITGHSMEPLISNGDIIAIKELKHWRDFILYGEVYGIITEDMRTVKVVTRSDRGEDFLRLVPTNISDEYQPQDIPVHLITHVFRVLGCMKKL